MKFLAKKKKVPNALKCHHGSMIILVHLLPNIPILCRDFCIFKRTLMRKRYQKTCGEVTYQQTVYFQVVILEDSQVGIINAKFNSFS